MLSTTHTHTAHIENTEVSGYVITFIHKQKNTNSQHLHTAQTRSNRKTGWKNKKKPNTHRCNTNRLQVGVWNTFITTSRPAMMGSVEEMTSMP